MTDIPWNDEAVLVRTAISRRGGETARTIEDEGTLREVVSRLRGRSDKRLGAFTIKLPDRGARPFAYVGDAIEILLATRLPAAPAPRSYE